MKKQRIYIAIKIVVTATLLFLVYRNIDLGGLRDLLASINPGPIVPFMVLLFVNSALSAYKWKILLRADTIEVPFPRLLVSYLIGTFFNLFLPSNIGGDAYRVYSIGKYTAKMTESFASVFADRLSGFVALVLICLGASAIGLESADRTGLIVVPLVILAGLCFMIWLLFHQRLARALFNMFKLNRVKKLDSFFNKILASFNAYRGKPVVLVKIMVISFVFQFIAAICIWTLSRCLHLEIPFLYFCIFVPIVTLMEAIPFSIFGVGFRDAGYVLFFSQANVPDPKAAALSMTILYMAATVVYSSSGGILFALSRGKRDDEKSV